MHVCFTPLLYIITWKLSASLAMSTAPVKSENLHNFSLPCLKWAQKNSTHRHRRLPDSPLNPSPQPDDPTHQLAPTQNEPPPSQEPCDEPGESAAKPWNLRPRKSVVAQTAAIESGEPHAETNQSDRLMKSQRNRVDLEGGVQKNDKKSKLWISLSKEEIEEDIYAMTGAKPARRPKRRPKNVQKQLDNVFPGLYLAGTCADSYRAQNSS